MERAKLEKLRAAAKAEYDLAMQSAKRRYREALASIDGVEKLQHRLAKPAKRAGRAKGSRSINGLASSILRILPGLSGQFTVSTLEEKLSQTGSETSNRASIATALRRLVEERDDLEVVIEGRGRRAAVYQMVARERGRDVHSVPA
jgi:hypothetical protein